MSPEERLDYFRSEFEGKIAKLEKQLAEERTVRAAAFRALEERLDKAVHALKNLEMSVA
jgi:hypothetical protein